MEAGEGLLRRRENQVHLDSCQPARVPLQTLGRVRESQEDVRKSHEKGEESKEGQDREKRREAGRKRKRG